MKNNFYGYIRVSSTDQNIARQYQELIKWGILEKNIFTDMLSGKDFERPSYQKLRKDIKEGDVIVVKSIDRLGRNYEEIQNEWRFITKDIQADIVIIDMPILDTRTNKDLIGTLISNIVLQLLSYVAQTEREYIKQRQAEGIAIARAEGKHLGRPYKPYPENFDNCFKLWQKKAITKSIVAKRLHVTDDEVKWLIRRKQNDIKNKKERK
ncbi:MAG: recombinase family protein [Erysipelotrichaceae bacterium]